LTGRLNYLIEVPPTINKICRAFTPQLAEWYKNFKKGPNGDKLDVVFVSSDRDEKSWKEYFAEMPWKALEFADRDKKVRHVPD
jgi:nucleoredoxin